MMNWQAVIRNPVLANIISLNNCSTCHFTVFRNVFIDMKFTRSQCIEKAHSYWCNKKITFCCKNSLKPVKNHRLHIFLAKCSFFGTLFIHQVYDHWTSGVAVLRVMRALNRLNYVNKLGKMVNACNTFENGYNYASLLVSNQPFHLQHKRENRITNS